MTAGAIDLRTSLKGARNMEVDYGPTQERKKQRVRAVMGKLPANIRYIPMDFTKDDLLTQLRTGGRVATRKRRAPFSSGRA